MARSAQLSTARKEEEEGRLLRGSDMRVGDLDEGEDEGEKERR